MVSFALVPVYCIIRWQEAAAAYGSASLWSISEPVNYSNSLVKRICKSKVDPMFDLKLLLNSVDYFLKATIVFALREYS